MSFKHIPPIVCYVLLSSFVCLAFFSCEAKNTDKKTAIQEETTIIDKESMLPKQDKPSTDNKGSTNLEAQTSTTDTENLDNMPSLSQERARQVLRSVRLKEGTKMLEDGIGEVDGKICYLYRYGEMHDDRFVSLEHFAVCDKDHPLVMDVIHGGNYVPYVTAP